jgi:hypothetical protein
VHLTLYILLGVFRPVLEALTKAVNTLFGHPAAATNLIAASILGAILALIAPYLCAAVLTEEPETFPVVLGLVAVGLGFELVFLLNGIRYLGWARWRRALGGVLSVTGVTGTSLIVTVYLLDLFVVGGHSGRMARPDANLHLALHLWLGPVALAFGVALLRSQGRLDAQACPEPRR